MVSLLCAAATMVTEAGEAAYTKERDGGGGGGLWE